MARRLRAGHHARHDQQHRHRLVRRRLDMKTASVVSPKNPVVAGDDSLLGSMYFAVARERIVGRRNLLRKLKLAVAQVKANTEYLIDADQ